MIADIGMVHRQILVYVNAIWYFIPDLFPLFVLFKEVEWARYLCHLYHLSLFKIWNIILSSLKWFFCCLINFFYLDGWRLTCFEKFVFIILTLWLYLLECGISVDIMYPCLIRALALIVSQSLSSVSLIKQHVMYSCLLIFSCWAKQTLAGSCVAPLLTVQITWTRLLDTLFRIILHSSIENLFGRLLVLRRMEVGLKAVRSWNINERPLLTCVYFIHSRTLWIWRNLLWSNPRLFSTSSTFAKSLLMAQACQHFLFLLFIAGNFVTLSSSWRIMSL